MIRRNVNTGSAPARTSSSSSANSLKGAVRPRRTGPGNGLLNNIWFLVGVAVFITVLTFVFPDETHRVEQEAVRDITMVEQEFSDYWYGKPPVAGGSATESKEAAMKRMMQQDSKWVDGERKLKEKLKVLAERQRQGKDIGVPVLTRYLGEDIPAWPEGMSKEEWQKKVDAKYAEMRKEEEEWKAQVAALLRDQTHG